MSCPNRCSGHGQCLTLAEAAAAFDGYTLNRSITYTGWDADMVRGCVCDAGFVGYDCSQRPCDVGHDPATTMGTSETVTLKCQCGPSCSGDFRCVCRHAVCSPHRRSNPCMCCLTYNTVVPMVPLSLHALAMSRLSMAGRVSPSISYNATNMTIANAVLGLQNVYTFKDQDPR